MNFTLLGGETKTGGKGTQEGGSACQIRGSGTCQKGKTGFYDTGT